jgi:hypothetical protein
VIDLYSCEARRFEDYVSNWFRENQIDPIALNCSMNKLDGYFSRSRAGRCEFSLPKKSFSLVEINLKLRHVGIDKLYEYEGCATNEVFKEKTSVKYISDVAPGPIFDGNTSTSFIAFYYNPRLELGCIDLHYPYG